jgi:uncharacterized membrane protein
VRLDPGGAHGGGHLAAATGYGWWGRYGRVVTPVYAILTGAALGLSGAAALASILRG